MQNLNDLQCPVCLQLCQNAVESKCCGHAYCQKCANGLKVNQCPMCRKSNFVVTQSKTLRRIISNIKVQCSNEKCDKKINHGDLKKHLQQCDFTNMMCYYCSNNFIAKQLADHTIKNHYQQLKKVIFQNNKLNNQKKKIILIPNNVEKKDEQFNLEIPIINSINRQAILGESQKFYCGGLLGFKCKCCDGYCGPESGQNCISCMMLDIKLRKLPKNYLVNANGKIVKVSENRKVFCGIQLSKFLFKKTRCNESNQCQYCKVLNITLPRYEQLLM